MEPSLFYTGLVAELYARLRSVTPDPEPYARFIARSGEPALELGCGDGDPLLDLVARGLEVEGLDSSPDMLERCRIAASARELDVVLHQQSMETMDLPRRYRSIYLAGATFNLLPDDGAATSALLRIGHHLRPGGSALIPLMIPTPTPPAMLGVPREIREPDGPVLRVTAQREDWDETDRRQTTHFLYERVDTDGTTALERPWSLHWHTQDGFRELAASAGLTTVAVLDGEGGRATDDASLFVFILTAAG